MASTAETITECAIYKSCTCVEQTGTSGSVWIVLATLCAFRFMNHGIYVHGDSERDISKTVINAKKTM